VALLTHVAQPIHGLQEESESKNVPSLQYLHPVVVPSVQVLQDESQATHIIVELSPY
jgi:hypothetical protein